MAAEDHIEPALSIDLVAASLRADASDVRAFVEALAVKLEEAVPGTVSVHRRSDRMFGPKRVQRMVVDAGDRRLELKLSGAGIETRCGRVSGGIVLKNEDLDTEEWLRALGEALVAQAQHSQSTRQALERLLNE